MRKTIRLLLILPFVILACVLGAGLVNAWQDLQADRIRYKIDEYDIYIYEDYVSSPEEYDLLMSDILTASETADANLILPDNIDWTLKNIEGYFITIQANLFKGNTFPYGEVWTPQLDTSFLSRDLMLLMYFPAYYGAMMLSAVLWKHFRKRKEEPEKGGIE